jgi:hypothetical protein
LAAASGAFDVQVIAQTFMGQTHYAVGDYWQGLDCMQRVIALLAGESGSARFGLPILPAATVGAAYALVGRAAEALPLLDQMLERVATGNPMFFPALVLTELSESLLLVNRVDEATFHRIMWWNPDPLCDPLTVEQSQPETGSSMSKSSSPEASDE